MMPQSRSFQHFPNFSSFFALSRNRLHECFPVSQYLYYYFTLLYYYYYFSLNLHTVLLKYIYFLEDRK